MRLKLFFLLYPYYVNFRNATLTLKLSLIIMWIFINSSVINSFVLIHLTKIFDHLCTCYVIDNYDYEMYLCTLKLLLPNTDHFYYKWISYWFLPLCIIDELLYTNRNFKLLQEMIIDDAINSKHVSWPWFLIEINFNFSKF